MQSHIHLKLFATLKKYGPPDAGYFSVKSGTSVDDLLEQLRIPRDKARLIFINGVKTDLSATLKDGDRVGIFPPVGGG